MKNFDNQIIQTGYKFVSTPKEPIEFNSDQYCVSRDIFIARLDKLRINLENKLNNVDIISLLVATIGEIGNNSFDHNLGNWRDVPGIYFDYNLEKKVVVLADRGQGIKKTIQKVKPEITKDLVALNVAFTQIISGRAPERRGNGLKFVSKVIRERHWRLQFYSGKAIATIDAPEYELNFTDNNDNIIGTMAVIEY